MIAVVQRVSSSSVKVEGEIVGQIGVGFNVLLGVSENDTEEDLQWLAKKMVGLRVFSDEEGKMNKDLKDVDGNILLISQFTLLGSTKKGNRPSFIEAARPEKAIPMYEKMKEVLSEMLGKKVECGIFGADMKVEIQNDGPVTLVIDTANKR
ncbi:D-aminoacyl-tRNA deacylase [Leadbetterella byssophila]|uniref:D-aminoacyl-tRNA deacylase n=1 Tax=Leadbetterella byssophila (strain DSM 17132 / JCM 16389 / KACC 11308 / NBRC 106382 / 4M15) TaxID=649349 RepID=E4RW98_LEAB4|nr:D-aminoacyl-tRNA deacylase [Leadbetterella byssophila]ADQ17133.1 D-tyrosyl-tRNA(Tyr) deacylase [Leadbetterella byssophila DSM 17132]